MTTKTGVHSHLKETYYSLQEKIQISNRDGLRSKSDSHYSFSSCEEIEIKALSEVLGPVDQYHSVRQIDTIHEIDQPFVAEIRNGKILNKSGFCTDDRYNIILETANSRESRVRGFYRYNIDHSLKLLYNQKFNDSGNNDGDYDISIGTSLIRTPRQDGSRKDNYSHWVQSYLTRLDGIKRYQEETNNNVKIIVEKDPPSWVLGSLELFGFEDNIAFWDPTEKLQVKQLVVPSIRRSEEWNDKHGINHKVLSKNACEWVRKEAVARTNVNPSKFSDKIFISRADAERRQIKNREEVLDYLQKHGFESYKLTELSFPEQVALFSQANEIIGVHGAGLANIMFASDCNVTEIIGGNFKPTYFMMADILDLNHNLVLGHSVAGSAERTHNQNIKIEPEKIL